MSKQTTRQTLLDAGTDLIFRQGYNHTGLNDVLAIASVPKGSFYYYFDSKEDFGLQVMEQFVDRAGKRIASMLADETLDPLTRLRQYFDWYANYLESKQCSQGCLLGNMGQELADQSEVFRVKIEEAMGSVVDAIAACLRAAQAQGQISTALDAQELAEFSYTAWQGALLRMKVTKSMVPIRTFLHLFFEVMLKS